CARLRKRKSFSFQERRPLSGEDRGKGIGRRSFVDRGRQTLVVVEESRGLRIANTRDDACEFINSIYVKKTGDGMTKQVQYTDSELKRFWERLSHTERMEILGRMCEYARDPGFGESLREQYLGDKQLSP